MIAETFLEMAQGLETGSFGKRPKIALTGMGSEHGEENAMEAALMAAKDGVDVYYIGTLEAEGVTTVKVANDEEGHKKMEEMLANGEVDGASNHALPIPNRSIYSRTSSDTGKGKRNVYSEYNRNIQHRSYRRYDQEHDLRNHCSKSMRKCQSNSRNPECRRSTSDRESSQKSCRRTDMISHFAESGRADGGCVMRGNDVLQASPDIMVTDSLTGNILVKMPFIRKTGGSFEATGYGYGPGIGEGYEQLVMIVSRASGAPVIAGAIRYAAQLVRNKVFEVAKAEFAAAKKAGLKEILMQEKQQQNRLQQRRM